MSLRDTYFVPVNYTDAGKLFGAFAIRNSVEAVLLAVPVMLLILRFPLFSFSTKLFAAVIAAVPLAGFALLGVNDDSLSQFLMLWMRWRKNRTVRLYRGN